MAGRRFGRLTVLRRAGSTPGGLALWACRCDCGGGVVARGSDLRDGTTASCGCAHGEAVSRRMTGTAEGRRHVRRLTRHVWPRVCPACGREFLGTAKQRYDRPECRPSRRN